MGSLQEYREPKNKIPFWKGLSDVFFVARGLWFFLLFDLLIFAFFILLPQGKDILLAIVENTGKDLWWTILVLMVGTVFWGMVAEFGARYTMYVTDNSGDSLSDERVEWRKLLQRTFSGFSLYYPPLIIMLGLTMAAFGSYSVGQVVSTYQFWVSLGLFGGLLFLLYLLYSKKKHLAVRGHDDEAEGLSLAATKAKQRKPGWLQLSDHEEEWASKLYGIYNPYVFRYPADLALKLLTPPLTSNPWNPANVYSWEADDGGRVTGEKLIVIDWPKKAHGEDGKPMVNRRFRFDRFSKKKDDIWARWFYRIPFGFFKRLHTQILVLVSICVVLLLFFSLIHNTTYQAVGAAGLVTFSFGCWCGVYIGLLFLDKAPIKVALPYRMLFFTWLLVCSWYNNDHPVRVNAAAAKAQDNRQPLAAHFASWLQDYQKRYYPNVLFDSVKGRVFPVLFVCAEGGACRTGAFTAMLLSKLQERYPTFNDRIYAYSSVSGGSLGVGFYNAIANFRGSAVSNQQQDPHFYTHLTEDFFGRDHLAAALGKLFFCEIAQLFWPRHIDRFDRAIALEQSWEEGYGAGLVGSGVENPFDSDYNHVFAPGRTYPAWFINTTCVETGEQCWLANVRPDALMPLADDRDVWRHLGGTTKYSTAINFSSRFPLVSPSAEVGGLSPNRRHYVDGGYFENVGAQTMADILRALAQRDSALFSHVQPIVLVLEYSAHGTPDSAGVRFGNEFTDILTGIYDTRSGRGGVALNDLKNVAQGQLGGQMIELPLDASGKKVPLNWLLSKRAVDDISNYCDTVLTSNTRLQYLEKILER